MKIILRFLLVPASGSFSATLRWKAIDVPTTGTQNGHRAKGGSAVKRLSTKTMGFALIGRQKARLTTGLTVHDEFRACSLVCSQATVPPQSLTWMGRSGRITARLYQSFHRVCLQLVQFGLLLDEQLPMRANFFASRHRGCVQFGSAHRHPASRSSPTPDRCRDKSRSAAHRRHDERRSAGGESATTWLARTLLAGVGRNSARIKENWGIRCLRNTTNRRWCGPPSGVRVVSALARLQDDLGALTLRAQRRAAHFQHSKQVDD